MLYFRFVDLFATLSYHSIWFWDNHLVHFIWIHTHTNVLCAHRRFFFSTTFWKCSVRTYFRKKNRPKAKISNWSFDEKEEEEMLSLDCNELILPNWRLNSSSQFYVTQNELTFSLLLISCFSFSLKSWYNRNNCSCLDIGSSQWPKEALKSWAIKSIRIQHGCIGILLMNH